LTAETASDRLVANWQHVKPGAVKRFVPLLGQRSCCAFELGDRLIEVFLKAATLRFNQAVRDSKKQEIEKA
jgi:hypothetical protein